MPDKDKVCTISGVRPYKLPSGLDLPELLNGLDEEIRKSVFQGYDIFQTGMAMGADIWAAEIILNLKKEFPGVRLICYQPCETQANGWPDAWRLKYYNILSDADEVICLQKHYSAGCMQRRNCAMIDSSSRLIAVHDKKSAGGTAQTIGYARRRGIDVVIIDPLNYLVRTSG